MSHLVIFTSNPAKRWELIVGHPSGSGIQQRESIVTIFG